MILIVFERRNYISISNFHSRNVVAIAKLLDMYVSNTLGEEAQPKEKLNSNLTLRRLLAVSVRVVSKFRFRGMILRKRSNLFSLRDSFLGRESIPSGFPLKDVFKSLLFRFHLRPIKSSAKQRHCSVLTGMSCPRGKSRFLFSTHHQQESVAYYFYYIRLMCS
jgi:hypothetical protein